MLYVLPYMFLISENSTLFSNQLRILISFVGAIIILFLQRKSFAFFYIITLLFLYLLQSIYFLIVGLEIYFLRSLSLSYIFISFFAIVLFQYRNYIDAKKISQFFSLVLILFFLFIVQILSKHSGANLIVRPHGLIILFILLNAVGIKLGKLNTILLFIATLSLSYFSYNSRIAQIVVLLLLFNEFGIKKIMVAFIPFLGLIPMQFFERFEQNGLDDFGRAYIYNCFIGNYNNLNFLLPTYKGLESCYEFEYLHSSYLILFVEYGVIPGLILILAFFYISISNIFKRNQIYPTTWIFLIVLLFSAVEGGTEWYFFYTIGLYLLNRFTPEIKLNLN